MCLCLFLSFPLAGYVSDQPPTAGSGVQHPQFVAEPESVPPMHAGVHGEYSSTTPLHPSGGPEANSQHNQEEPFSPPELIPIGGSQLTSDDVIPNHMNPTATLSHDRQVSIDSCSNLVIDEQGSTTRGGFPNATPSPSSGYGLTSDSHPDDQQGFTPFVLATQTLEDPHTHSNGGLGRSQQLTHRTEEHGDSGSQHIPQAPDDHSGDKETANSPNEGQISNSLQNVNKGKPHKQKRRNYNPYSSDDDDDVFLPNPPPKSQADRCTIAMETDEEKSATVKEMELQQSAKENADDMVTADDAVTGGEILGTTATEIEGETTATEEELDVVNDSQTEEEKNQAAPSSAAIISGT